MVGDTTFLILSSLIFGPKITEDRRTVPNERLCDLYMSHRLVGWWYLGIYSRLGMWLGCGTKQMIAVGGTSCKTPS